jgi:hypothetical protein
MWTDDINRDGENDLANDRSDYLRLAAQMFVVGKVNCHYGNDWRVATSNSRLA